MIGFCVVVTSRTGLKCGKSGEFVASVIILVVVGTVEMVGVGVVVVVVALVVVAGGFDVVITVVGRVCVAVVVIIDAFCVVTVIVYNEISRSIKHFMPYHAQTKN